MNIVLGSGIRNDPKLSIALVQKMLQHEFIEAGQSASCLYADDFNIRVRRVTELEFALKASMSSKLLSADVVDFKVGDGLFTSIRSRFLTRHSQQLIVSRSHGLDFINYAVRQDFLKVYGGSQSWREKLYAGGYLLWQVHQHMRIADLCLFLNSFERDFAINELGIDAQKSFVIDNGIPDYLIGLDRPSRNTPQRPQNLAVIGTYTTRKINNSSQAFNVLLERYPETHLGFLGTNTDDIKVFQDYDVRFHQRIRNVKTFDHRNLATLLADYDILCFPSMADGFGMVVFEAMACGLAVVASDLPGLTSRLIDGQEALFFRKLVPESLVATIERVRNDGDLLFALRNGGYKKAQDFSWRRIALQTLDLYRQALQRKRAREV